MQFIRNFEKLFEMLRTSDSPRRRVAVAYPHDDHTLEAVAGALERGFADFALVGPEQYLRQLDIVAQHAGHVEIIDAPDPDQAARTAVQTVRDGRAGVLMKGTLNTDNLLRAVLNKEQGILPAGNVLSHITVAEFPDRDKLLMFSDAAVIPNPTLAQRQAQIEYMVSLCRYLGIEQPRVGLVHFTEKINPKFSVSTDYETLRNMAAEGAWGNAIVDGPMDLRTAIDPEAGPIKGIHSPVEGRADALMMPDIEAGNVFYKTVSYIGRALNAGMLVGAMAPVVLPSRGDSTESKLCSLALACLMAR